jgi:hypothetical protein
MAKRGRKKIDTWEYKGNDGAKLLVPVYIINDAYNHKEDIREIQFEVDLPDIDVKERDADLNALQVTVFKLIAEKLLVKWEPFLWVKVSGSAYPFDMKKRNAYDHLTMEVNIEVTPIEIGTMPMGGKIHRKTGYSETSEGMPATGEEEKSSYGYSCYSSRQPPQRSLVPDTPANREALNDIALRFEALIQNLRRLLSTEQVEQFLANSLASNLLPAPKEE